MRRDDKKISLQALGRNVNLENLVSLAFVELICDGEIGGKGQASVAERKLGRRGKVTRRDH